MGLFRKRDEVLDLSQKYREQLRARHPVARTQDMIDMTAAVVPAPIAQESPKQSSFNPFGFFESSVQPQTSSFNNTEPEVTSTGGLDEDKRRKLAKRLGDMTERIEELSNQVYQLQQRIETLERRNPGY